MTYRQEGTTNYDCSIYEYLQRGTADLDKACALQFLYKRISHAALRRAVAHMAASLAELGVRRGDVVTLCMPNVPVAVSALYAISYLGAVASVLHPLTPPEAVLDTMRDTHSGYLLCFDKLYAVQGKVLSKADIHIVVLSAGEYFGAVERAVIQIVNHVSAMEVRRYAVGVAAHVTIYNSRRKVAEVSPATVGGEDLCLYLHSGGTTGVPKTIPITNRMLNVEANAIIHLTQPPEVGRSSMLMVLPIFHGFGIAVCLHAMLPYGVRVVLQAAFDAAQSVSIIKRQRVTYLAGVPTMFNKMLATGRFKGKGLGCLQNAYCGGDLLPADIKERFDAACARSGSPCRLYQGYGLTETVAVCCANSPFAPDLAGSIGRPAVGVQMAVYDEQGHALPNGERGEICVSGDTVMQGYLGGTPEGVLQTHDGRQWLHTGDCGYRDAEGYYHFVGRKKRMSIIAGVNVYHQEIEQLASTVEGVQAAAVCEVARPKTTVKLWLVVEEGHGDVCGAVRRYLAEHLTKYCVPRDIEVIDAMPLTAMGKIDYRALADRAAQKAEK